MKLTDHGAVGGRDDLLAAGRESDTGAARLGVVRDDGRVVARRAGHSSAVARLLLHVADRRSLGQRRQREHVADRDRGCKNITRSNDGKLCQTFS